MSGKIDGVPRDLIEDALAIATTHSTANWSAEVRDRLRALLAAPVADRPQVEVEGDEFYFAKPVHPIIKALNDKGVMELVALKATVDQQAKMIEYLQGAPVVERQDPTVWIFHDDTGELRATDRWDIAKHLPMKLTPVYTSPPAPALALTMKDVMEANESVIGISLMTSNQCHALAQALTKVYADKLKELNQ